MTDRLVLEADFPDVTPAALFDLWTVPAQLTRWWGQEAVVEPGVGGVHDLSWPAMGWHLRGRHTAWEPGERLGFTWRFDHQPALPERHVEVRLAPRAGGGTALSLTHGTYMGSAADQQDRQDHLAGWTHFLAQLRALTQAG